MWNGWLVPESSSGYPGFDGEIVEERLHIEADSFVVAVDACPVRGFVSHAGLRTAARIGAMSWSRRVSRAAMVRLGWDVVAAGSAGFVEPFASQFAQTVRRLAEAVADVIVPGAGVPVGGELGGGEPVGRRRPRPGGAHRVAHPGFVEVDAPMPVAPSRTPVGSPSRMASRMNPVSTQSRAVANRAAMPASRVTISANLSIILPQRNSAVLCAIASNRSTRSPLV